MRKRILLVIAACLLLSGCGDARPPAVKADPAAELEISLYCTADNANVDAYIWEFRDTYKNVTVNKTVFDTIEQFDETVANELNAGKGPDVVLFSPHTSLDLMQMAKNGAFAPLDAYMEISDAPANAETYIAGTFEAGKIGDKQYILPVSITVPFLAYGLHRSYPFEAEPILPFIVFRDAVYGDIEQFRDDEETGIFSYTKSLESLLLSAQILQWDADYKDISYDAGQMRDFVEFIADVQRDYDAKSADMQWSIP